MSISFGSAASTTNIPSGNPSTTLSISIVPGSTVVVIAGNNSSIAVQSVTDNASPPNVYTKQGSTAINGTQYQEIWSTGASAARAATSVTVTWVTAPSPSDWVAAATYLGVSLVGTAATPTTGTGTSLSISLTLANGSDWVVAGLSSYNVNNVVPTSWSSSVGNLRASAPIAESSGAAAIADNSAATLSSVTCTAISSQSQAWTGCALLLRTPVYPAQASDDEFQGSVDNSIVWQT